MLDRSQSSHDGLAIYVDDELATLVAAANERIARLEKQIAEESAASLSLMMRGVLAEAHDALEQLKAEQVRRKVARARGSKVR